MKSVVSFAVAVAVAVSPAATSAAPKVCADCIRDNLAVLASNDMHGRACGSSYELAAAAFIQRQLSMAVLLSRTGEGAFSGSFLQPVTFRVPSYSEPPSLTVGPVRLIHGADIVVVTAAPVAAGTLVVLGPNDSPSEAAGRVALLDAPQDAKAVSALFDAGATLVIVPATDRALGNWSQLADRPPGPVEIDGVSGTPSPPLRTLVFARPEAVAKLRALGGRSVQLSANRGEPHVRTTNNIVGVVRGTAPDAEQNAILLSAHYDHIGERNGVVFPGANDDATGVAAVLEFARMLGAAAKKPPRRTVYFALFGCEEEGGHGAKYFMSHPPTPIASIAANLEFEMIGLPDPKHPKTLMLTGWERSNLGPMLKAQGADIGPDAYPEQNFFQRSDNYQLALKGVVAQTISAWPVPPTYHQPSDDLAHVDLAFMAEVVQSLAGPIEWLLNNDFRPVWSPGMQP